MIYYIYNITKGTYGIMNSNNLNKKILYMLDHIEQINKYNNDRKILIRYTNGICENCNINNTSSHKHYYCYNCIVNNKEWFDILNNYKNKA